MISLLAAAALAAAAPDTSTFQLQTFPPGDAQLLGPRPGAADSNVMDLVSSFVQVRAAGFSGWDDSGGVYIGTRMGPLPQVYRVSEPLGDRRQLTFFSKRISSARPNPVPGRRNLLFTLDEGGNEEFRLGLFDFRTGEARILPMPAGRASEVNWDDSGKTYFYAHTPKGTDRWDIRRGSPEGWDTLLHSGPGTWLPQDLSPDGSTLLVSKYISATESEMYLLSMQGGALTRLLPREGPQNVEYALWVKTGRSGKPAICFASDREGEFTRLYLLEPSAEALPVPLSGPADWDVEWASASKDKRTLVYSLNVEGVSRLYSARPGSGTARPLPGLPEGLIDYAHFRHPRPGHGLEFAFSLNSSAFPGDVYTYDLGKRQAVRWTRSETGGLPPETFRLPELIKYPTFDSVNGKRRMIPAWLYLPTPAKRHGQAPPSTQPPKYPVVISIHGGPEQQARPGFESLAQYFLARGLAVVVPNVRGSNGYGKTWLKADDGRLRMGAVRDIGALVDWIGARGDLDSGRVAVIGRSYGGFMSLATLVAYGSRLQAGVSTVGITHFPTFLKNTSGYRRDLRRVEYGDERDPSMAAFLDSISPLTNLPRIKSPLLLCHGRNDPRVPHTESEAIFSALKARSVPVWFLSFRDEGHAFRDEASRTVYYRVIGEFLVRYLKP